MKFAVIGGDMRHVKLAELLFLDGHKVSSFAMDKIRLNPGIDLSNTSEEAALDADCVILPLPINGKDGMLNAPLSTSSYFIENILNSLSASQLVCAGRVEDRIYELSQAKGLTLIDYFAREELAVANAVATAEGAIQLAMEETAITLCCARCLVIGFGRIGKLLAHRLRGLGAFVSVSSRRFSDMAWCRAYGYEALSTENLEGHLRNFDLIINTVPARVLDAGRLAQISPGCLCMDLASKPGGMDFAAAASLGLKAIWALSLPGEVAPVTSGIIIRDTIYNILRERELAQ